MIHLNEYSNSHIKKLTRSPRTPKTKIEFNSIEFLLHTGPNLYKSFVVDSKDFTTTSIDTTLNKFRNALIFMKINTTETLYIVSSEREFYRIDRHDNLLDQIIQLGTQKGSKLSVNICCEVELKQLCGLNLGVPSEMTLSEIFGQSLKDMKVLYAGEESSLDLSQQRQAIEFADTNLLFVTNEPKEDIFFYFGENKITINKSKAKNKHAIQSKILRFTNHEENHGLDICVIEEQTGTLCKRSNNLIRFRKLHDDPNQETHGIREGDRVSIIELIDCYYDSNNQIHVYQFSPDRSLIYSFRVPYDLTVKEHITRFPLHTNTTKFDHHSDPSDYYLAYSDAMISEWYHGIVKNTNMVSLTSKFSDYSSYHILLYYSRCCPGELKNLYQLYQNDKPARSSIIYNHILSEIYTTIKCETSFKGLKVQNSPSINSIKQEIWYFWNLMSHNPDSWELIQDVFGKLIKEWDGSGELYETIYLMVVGKPQFKNIEDHLRELVNKMNLYLMIKPPEPLESNLKRKRGDKSSPKEQRVIFNVSPDLTLDEIITRSGLFNNSQSQKIQFTIESPKGTQISHREIIPHTVKTSIETPLELFWKKTESHWGTKTFPSQQELLTSAIHEKCERFEYFYKITKLGNSDIF
jgi:hypothetical protein